MKKNFLPFILCRIGCINDYIFTITDCNLELVDDNGTITSPGYRKNFFPVRQSSLINSKIFACYKDVSRKTSCLVTCLIYKHHRASLVHLLESDYIRLIFGIETHISAHDFTVIHIKSSFLKRPQKFEKIFHMF